MSKVMAAINCDLRALFDALQSPIETSFLRAAVGEVFAHPNLNAASYFHPPGGALVAEEAGLHIWVQPEVSGFFPDFLFTAKLGTTASALIECDGHEFHERTKEQASRDKARDRALQAAGYRILRFTGSEIHRDAGACAVEAISCVVLASVQ